MCRRLGRCQRNKGCTGPQARVVSSMRKLHLCVQNRALFCLCSLAGVLISLHIVSGQCKEKPPNLQKNPLVQPAVMGLR